ncbi:peptidase domain-containing ABC transporter [Terracoccus luteus]|uniref:ABC-type bacteriocin/lantibiotic exporter with double-glycine peptidase domain n=1 Tax=Terracoccus luteus TaxID=53356 RepID=A0A495Y4S3_9MICO|nr:ATP-binding cassette domain-containing protein [Terracoccus luteus]MBB2987448.1 ABC-type bacteriocin/lantibiotic exporter with double-glycine peptidase domain [Terracoccus luteus]MCP2173099.1 ABC-type bacteriocin/lantibiotic exporter with double-glycine peptidase domain [Terracoccus luteus]RKT79848.1 ABC-type bacteriocin/lantibiotic exporter with double-glycine peptidase domain [Terracoccus luteus]
MSVDVLAAGDLSDVGDTRAPGASGAPGAPGAPTGILARGALVVLASLVCTAGQVGGMFAAFVAYADPQRATPAVVVGLALFVIAYLAGTASDRLGLRVQEEVADLAERRVWSRLLSLPVAFYAERSLRDVIGYANCVGMTRSLLGALGTESALGALTAAVATVLLCLVDLRLGLVALGVATTVLVAAVLLSWRQQQHDHVVMESVDAAHATLYPALTGLEELTAYGAQGTVERAWQRIFTRQKDADLRGLRYADAGESLLLSTQTVMLAVLCPLALLWSNGLLALGSVTMIVLQLAGALGRLAGVLPAVFSMGLARRRLTPVLTAAPEQTSAARPHRALRGRIELDHVGFGYPGSTEPVLDGVSLVVEPGSMVAVVGPSGAGKSTLLRLVLAQLEPTSGRVLVDGVGTADWDHEDLRDQIGYVPQSAALLRGTVRDAVVGVRDDVDDDDVLDALRTAGLGDLVATLPMGLDTRISDGESGFSGGQEQRFLLARALVRRPSLLVLDEATSALDETTQETVATAVAGLGMTRLVVAHRHSTIRMADQVYVLDGGRVVEHGRHDELLLRQGRLHALTRTAT